MNRNIVLAASVVVIIAIIVWLRVQQEGPPAPTGAADAPRQYDTTGGQEIRPRWDNSGGQADDGAGN